MKMMMLTLLSLMAVGCANIHPPNTQENRPNHHNVDPNCQRDVPPPPSTAHGFPDFNSPEYQEQQFNKRHCR